jgi:hypothetical protein
MGFSLKSIVLKAAAITAAPKKLVQKTTLAIAAIPKPVVDMHALQQATGIIAGIVSLTPVGKAVVAVSTAIADKATGGKATAYLTDGHGANSTLSMLPGGNLIQGIVRTVNPNAADTLNKMVPDPKKMLIHDVVQIGSTVASHPSVPLFGAAEKKKMMILARSGVNTVIKNASDARALAQLVGVKDVSTLPRSTIGSTIGKRVITGIKPSMAMIVQAKIAPSVSSTLNNVMQHSVAPVAKASLFAGAAMGAVAARASTLPIPGSKAVLTPDTSTLTTADEMEIAPPVDAPTPTAMEALTSAFAPVVASDVPAATTLSSPNASFTGPAVNVTPVPSYLPVIGLVALAVIFLR